MLTVTVIAIDAQRPAAAVDDDHGVRSIELAGAAQILYRVTGPIHARHRHGGIIPPMKPSDCILFSGGAPGAEAAFGAMAERHGVEEVHFTFDGHKLERHRGVRALNHEELLAGDVSLQYVSRLMHRRYTEGPTVRKVLQTLWYQVNNGQEIYVIGSILDDGTVRGGTGWGAEFAKLCNKPLCVFDQDRDAWSRWTGDEWQTLDRTSEPVITHAHFTGTGTRTLRDNGARAIEALFHRSFS